MTGFPAAVLEPRGELETESKRQKKPEFLMTVWSPSPSCIAYFWNSLYEGYMNLCPA